MLVGFKVRAFLGIDGQILINVAFVIIIAGFLALDVFGTVVGAEVVLLIYEIVIMLGLGPV